MSLELFGKRPQLQDKQGIFVLVPKLLHVFPESKAAATDPLFTASDAQSLLAAPLPPSIDEVDDEPAVGHWQDDDMDELEELWCSG